MKRFLALSVVCAAAVLTSSRAWAWNAIGHLASAKLAYDELDDGQRAELFALLHKHSHFIQYLAAARPPEVGEMEWAVLRAAVWPDWVRPRHNGSGGPDPRGPGITKYSRSEEHYVDVPLIDPKDTVFFAGKTLIPPDGTDIICALRQRCNDLRTKNAAAEDKAVAICWIFHLVGDIHQPLHNAEYFSSEEGFQHGDQGGNRFGVKINGRKWKLHAFWDDLLGEDAAYWDDSPEHQRHIFRDAMKVAHHLQGLQLSDADKEKLAKNLSFASWSQEGFELAKTIAYQKTDGSGILDHVEIRPGQPIPESAPEAGARYAEIARATAEVRIVLAGKRLAERIKRLLGSTAPSATFGMSFTTNRTCSSGRSQPALVRLTSCSQSRHADCSSGMEDVFVAEVCLAPAACKKRLTPLLSIVRRCPPGDPYNFISDRRRLP